MCHPWPGPCVTRVPGVTRPEDPAHVGLLSPALQQAAKVGGMLLARATLQFARRLLGESSRPSSQGGRSRKGPPLCLSGGTVGCEQTRIARLAPSFPGVEPRNASRSSDPRHRARLQPARAAAASVGLLAPLGPVPGLASSPSRTAV